MSRVIVTASREVVCRTPHVMYLGEALGARGTFHSIPHSAFYIPHSTFHSIPFHSTFHIPHSMTSRTLVLVKRSVRAATAKAKVKSDDVVAMIVDDVTDVMSSDAL